MADTEDRSFVIYCGPSGTGKTSAIVRSLATAGDGTAYLDRDGLRRSALMSVEEIDKAAASGVGNLPAPLKTWKETELGEARIIREFLDAGGPDNRPSSEMKNTDRRVKTSKAADESFGYLLEDALQGPAKKVMIDWPMEKLPEGLALIDAGHKAGRKVVIEAFTRNTEDAFARVTARRVRQCQTEEECRQELMRYGEQMDKVRFESFLKTHLQFPDAFDRYREHADEMRLWNSPLDGQPWQIASQRKGGQLEIDDPAAWEEFGKKRTIDAENASYTLHNLKQAGTGEWQPAITYQDFYREGAAHTRRR